MKSAPSISLRALALSSLVLLGFPFACSSTPELTDPRIGRSCTEDGDCGGGLICSSQNFCGVSCKAGEPDEVCEGKVCRADGICPFERGGGLDSSDSGGGLDAGGSGNDGGGSCIDVQVDFSPQVPSVLLLIDRSGSMNDGAGFGSAVAAAVEAGDYEPWTDCRQSHRDYRWNVVRDVLLNPDKGIVKPLEDRVRFGLGLYTSLDGSIDGGECPMLETVPLRLNNHEDMLDSFRCSDFPNDGDTPTGPALVSAAEILDAFDEPGPKIIVLATDGEPDDCECPDFSGSVVPSECRAQGAAQRVKDDVVDYARQIHEDTGIVIHVINVSTPSNSSLQTHLQEVAEAGGGQSYPGFNPVQLGEAFETIIGGARSCVIDLEGEITPGKESTGTVTLNGQPLGLDDPDGWRVNTPQQIELLGDSCEAIKSGDPSLDIKFPCGSFVIVPR